MNERFLSRFHVALDLPELTTATRETMWQKCLESHKDISFFVDCKTLAGWPLNGREIDNAITAAKTLAVNGTLDMKHLERVIPASKRLIERVPIFEDPWGFPPVSKDKKKKKGTRLIVEDAVEIVEEPPKRNDDDWVWGLKKKTKKEPVESNSPAGVGVPKEQAIDKEMDPQAPTVEDGLGSPPVSKDKKTKKAVKAYIDDAVEIIEEPAKRNDDDWGWGLKKKTKKEPVESNSAADVGVPKEQAIDKGMDPQAPIDEDPLPVPKDKKKKKVKTPVIDEIEEPTESNEVTKHIEGVANINLPPSDSEMGWAGFGRKKEKKPEKKSKKASITEPEEPLSAEAATTSQPLSYLDMGWGAFVSREEKKSEKKPKKTKKKTVIEEPPSPPVDAEII